MSVPPAQPRLLASRPVKYALVIAVLSVVWLAVAPLDTQRLAIKIATPLLAGTLAITKWRIGYDPRQTPAAARFWRILALGMSTYTAGMVVDLIAFVAEFSHRDIGQVVFYPVAGGFTVVALVVFPTAHRDGAARLKIALDVAAVLFGVAVFVWYFVVSRRWRPSSGWEALSDGLVLPAVTLVAGFVILRVTLAGAAVINRPTMLCFVTGACSAALPILIGAPPDTNLGRLVSITFVFGLSISLVGVALQQRAGPPSGVPARVAWRRPFSALPYGVVLATLVLLLLAVRNAELGYRGWVVVAGVLLLCVIVMARQLTSLWENSRLLTANGRLTERLRHQAFHDSLTGLANRALFADRVAEALAGTLPVAVLFVDLDDFKLVNDSLGHDVGDRLLIEVAGRLRAAVPDEHVLARLGGDEFALLVVDVDAEPIAERVIAALRDPLVVAGIPVTVRASVGIATTPPGERDAAALLRDADVAMYAAKHEDKGGWRAFQPDMLAALLHRHRMQEALVEAVARDDFEVHYQPIVNLADGALHGAEALVRWRRPDGTLLWPGEFIPLAEETGLVADIDRLVLARACRQVADWRAWLPDAEGFTLHVNLSARALHRADLPADVARILDGTGLPAHQLTLEITESGLGADHEGATARLLELHALGVRLAIDDFGTGYSSLGYLRSMPVHVLKIDKSFITELNGTADSAPLAQAVIALATVLRMDTVAEGIEAPHQARRLLALGCRYGQGFHFSEPLPAALMAAMLVGATFEAEPSVGAGTIGAGTVGAGTVRAGTVGAIYQARGALPRA